MLKPSEISIWYQFWYVLGGFGASKLVTESFYTLYRDFIFQKMFCSTKFYNLVILYKCVMGVLKRSEMEQLMKRLAELHAEKTKNARDRLSEFETQKIKVV